MRPEKDIMYLVEVRSEVVGDCCWLCFLAVNI